MTNSQFSRRAKLREELIELRNAALAKLEQRGYAVRGKTPAQIRQMIKQRPPKSASLVAITKCAGGLDA